MRYRAPGLISWPDYKWAWLDKPLWDLSGNTSCPRTYSVGLGLTQLSLLDDTLTRHHWILKCYLEFGSYIFLRWAAISGDQCWGTEIILGVIRSQKFSISKDLMMITAQDTPWSDGGPQLSRPMIHPPNASQRSASDDMDGEPIWSSVDGMDE